MRIVRTFHSSSEWGIDARGHDLSNLPEGGGPEEHPLLGAEEGGAMLEQLGALLAPIATPVGLLVKGSVAVEGGEDVPGVDSGHDNSFRRAGRPRIRPPPP
jgi:hypothetical protein